MIDRRKFLKHTGRLGLAGILLPQLSRAHSLFASSLLPADAPDPRTAWLSHPIGLQLYTLGDLMITDPKGTLEKLAAIGYKEVESAGSKKGNFYGFTPKEFSAMVKAAGMHWRSAHVGGAPFTPAQMMRMAKTADDSARIQKYADQMKNRPKTPNLKDDYQQLADQAAEGGLDYLVCSSIPVHTFDEIKTAVEVFSKAGEACKKNGVQFAYHNHTTEFDEVEGHRPFDYILSNTDKDLVKMELDLAWATKAKQDPVELFKLHPGRYPLWHVKDLDKAKQQPAEVGTGIVDFKRIFDNAKESGMKYFFVEQDGAPQPLENVTHSFNYLKNMQA
jgi:sugar phosphate isomerase/epimerase